MIRELMTHITPQVISLTLLAAEQAFLLYAGITKGINIDDAY